MCAYARAPVCMFDRSVLSSTRLQTLLNFLLQGSEMNFNEIVTEVIY